MIYKQELEVPSYLCDIDDRLHVWAAVRLCQEVTEYHGNATGIGFKTLVQQNRAWVITHAYYNIYRLPMAFEKIMLNTWSRGNNGLIASRDYRVLTEGGEERGAAILEIEHHRVVVVRRVHLYQAGVGVEHGFDRFDAVVGQEAAAQAEPRAVLKSAEFGAGVGEELLGDVFFESGLEAEFTVEDMDRAERTYTRLVCECGQE